MKITKELNIGSVIMIGLIIIILMQGTLNLQHNNKIKSKLQKKKNETVHDKWANKKFNIWINSFIVGEK